MPEVVAVLTGRFARNPQLYYSMRLARVTDHVQSVPDDLEAYDDAGVACDRLGRGNEAIGWMEKKRAVLEKLDPSLFDVTEHRYRYHANLGTFLVHRWARQGGDRSKIDEVKAARDEIARALEINPNAHFGRERYQLRALDWIVDPPKMDNPNAELPNLLGWSFGDMDGEQTTPKEADDAVRGLAGLVVLGNAWESVDVFHALNVALQRDSLGYMPGREGGRNTLAYLASLRCRELIDAGKGSMLPDTPKGESLKALLPHPKFVSAEVLLDGAFKELRREADAWQAARTAFMTKRMSEGSHPDTDPSFWNGYTEPKPPGLPAQSVPAAAKAWERARVRITLFVMIGLPLFAVALVASRYRNARRRSRRSSVKPIAGVDGSLD
jgi:hypothetical protein